MVTGTPADAVYFHDTVGTVVLLAVMMLCGVAVTGMAKLWRRVVLR